MCFRESVDCRVSWVDQSLSSFEIIFYLLKISMFLLVFLREVGTQKIYDNPHTPSQKQKHHYNI